MTDKEFKMTKQEWLDFHNAEKEKISQLINNCIDYELKTCYPSNFGLWQTELKRIEWALYILNNLKD